MALFGRGQDKFGVNPTGHDKLLERAIKLVKSNQKVDSIVDHRDAEMVLDVLLEGFGEELVSRHHRDNNLTVEEHTEQILRKVDNIYQLLDSSVATTEVRAALSSFVFNAGVAFAAPAPLVQSAFAVMMESDDLRTYQSLADTDSLFSGRLKSYIAQLTPAEAKGFIDVFNRASLSVPQLAKAFSQIASACEAQLEKPSISEMKKSANSPSGKRQVKLKYCGNCGSPLDATAKFCGSCGASVPN
jgi:hypothetical protein